VTSGSRRRLGVRLALLTLLGLATVAIVLAIVVMRSEALRWRAAVVRAKFMGNLPEIPLRDLVRWLGPESEVYLASLAENPNVNAGVLNHDRDDGASLEKGRLVYGKFCASCHGAAGRGLAGTDLVASVGNSTDWAFFSATKWGRPGTAMAAQPVSDGEIWDVHAYMRSLGLAASLKEDGVPTSSRITVNVAPEAVLAASERPQEWLTYAGNYSGHRHSGLSQISRKNVGSLRVAWISQLRSADRWLEASPIAAGGLVFVTESPAGVVALDAQTGERVWETSRPMAPNLLLCCGTVNRGVAILGSKIFVATPDAHLVTLDATSGRRLWEVMVADNRDGYAMTGAPLAFKDRVLVGVSGGDYGIRGFVAAFSTEDGRLLWKFHTVPGPGEVGHETWAGDSWKIGGAATWSTGAYDSQRDTVYWGVGNPAPPHHGGVRAGDNLFANSVVALDATSGKLRWHYQFTPADEHDWDAVQQPVLARIAWQGQPRDVVLWANRNGFFYVLDRDSGKFLSAKAFVKQTWAAGFDQNGRPISHPEARPSRTGSLVWPWVGGGTNWWPPSYDNTRRLFYVPSVDAASVYFRDENARFRRGQVFMGGMANNADNQPVIVAIKAIVPETGEVRWERRLAQGGVVPRVVGGVLSTAGGLVFGGYRDEFFAFDSDSGEKLWQIRVGANINAAPVSYAVDGRQFVAIVAGHALFTFSLPSSN
jgi:alcohol dehydrogenase (cytochrome c)